MENFSYHEQLKREMEERQKPKLNLHSEYIIYILYSVLYYRHSWTYT